MRIAVFWSNITFSNVEEKYKSEILHYYLFEKNLSFNSFNAFFKNLKSYELAIYSSPERIINTNDKIINPNFFSEFDAIFILAELNWDNHALSEFYGIKVVQLLRLNNVKVPIFICSFASEKYLINKYGFLILRSMGHYFIHLPTGITKDYEIRLLEEMELFDIQSHFCDLPGAIRTIWHKKPEALAQPFKDRKNFIKGLLNNIRNISNLPEALNRETIKIENELDNIEEKSFLTFLDENTDKRFLIHLEDDNENSVFDYSDGWEILILEDQPIQIKVLKERLESIHSSLKVHIAISYSEAKKIIKEDIFNKITVAIVDYRLEDQLGNFKDKQGYSFISWLLQQYRFTEIFVYSGQSRTTVLNTFTKFGITPNYKRKTEVTGNVVNDFLEEIIDKGNQMYFALLNQPRTGIWEYSLKRFYAHYRNHKDYILFEQQISDVAKRYIKQLDYFLNLSTNDEENGWFNSLLKGGIIIPPFKDVRKYQLRKVGDSTPPKPKHYGEEDEFFEAFKTILVIRRIVLWLKNQNGIDNWVKIANLIFEGTFYSNKAPLDKALMTYSCVSDEDYPSRILVEEKNWFKSIIYDYYDPESINDKEKIVFFDKCINDIFKLISNNIEIIKSQSDLYKEIQSYFVLNRIIKKENSNKLFTTLNSVLGEHFLEFLSYLFNKNDFLLKNEVIKEHINSKDKSVKKSINKNISSILKLLDEIKDKIDYISALKIFFSKDRGELIENLNSYFHVEYAISCQHPYELLKLTKLLRRYSELSNNSDILNIEQELSRQVNIDHYNGAN